MLIAQKLVDFGAKHGNHDIKEATYHRPTLKNKLLPEITSQLEESIQELLRTTLSETKLAFTTDMWSDKYKQRHFLSLHVHFISRDWKKKALMLGVEEFDEESKTTANIKNFINTILTRYFRDDTEEIIKKSCGVTAGGSNFLAVFPTRYPCYCHKQNLIMQWTLNQKPLPSEREIIDKDSKGQQIKQKKLINLHTHCPAIKDVLVQLKKLVEYFKESGINKNLKISLKQDVETRWNSQVVMLESYLRSADEVKQILLEKKKVDKISKISDDVVDSLVDFLKPFQECTEALSGDKYPTLHLVAIWHWKLVLHMIRKETDSEEMSKLKGQARLCFEEYFVVQTIHYFACVLHP